MLDSKLITSCFNFLTRQLPGIFEIIVRKVALAQFCKVNGDGHFFTAIVEVNLFFIHFNDVRCVELNSVDVLAAIGSCYGRGHGSGINGLASGSIDNYDL